MTREVIAVGSAANDGTGDTLRQAGQKINNNFQELYQFLGGNATSLSSGVTFDSTGIIFEGAVANDFETKLTVTNPTADRTARIPNYTGELLMDSATQTIINKTLVAPYIQGPIISLPKIWDADSSHTYNVIGGSLSGNINVTLPNLTVNDTFVMSGASQTLSNKSIYLPIVQQSLRDSSGATILGLTRTSSAVHNITITNTVTAQPQIGAAGTADDVHIKMAPKGKGSTILKPAFNAAAQSAQGNIDSAAGFVYFTHTANIEAYLGAGTIAGESKILLNRTAQGTNPIVTVMPYSSTQTNSFRIGAGTGTTIVLQRGGCAHMIWDGLLWNVIGYGLDSSTSSELITLN